MRVPPPATAPPPTMQRLSVNRQNGSIVMAGVIDERCRLRDLLTDKAPLCLDLAAITFINSLGIREWIAFLADAEAAQVAVKLVRVSEPLVAQFNMIVATRGHADVQSFFAPYACDACGSEAQVLLEVEAHRQSIFAGHAPGANCATCKIPMAFDDFPERYFLFLREAR